MTRQRSCDNHARYQPGCDPCNFRSRRYAIRRKLRGQAMSEPAAPIRQMVRELRAAGYPLPMLEAETGLNRNLFYRLSNGVGGDWVQLRTAAAIRTAYVRLKDFPGPDVRAALWARKSGWTPPLPPEIDDDPVIDRVAIDRALTGERVHLTPEERAVAVAIGNQRGILPYQISELLGMNGGRVKAYLAGVQPKKRGPKKQQAA